MFNGFHGIAWAGDPFGVLAIEHRDIVIVVASGEDVFGLEVEESTEFGEGGAFIVVLVAKADIDGIAHKMEPGDAGDFFGEEEAELLHFGFGIGDEADQATSLVNGVGEGMFGEIRLDVAEELGGLGKEGIVGGEATGVPVAKIDPSSVGTAVKNFPFGSEEEVGFDGGGQFFESFFDVPADTSRIDRPKDATGAEFGECGEEFWDHGRGTLVIDEGAIKVGAEEFDRREVSCVGHQKRRWSWAIRRHGRLDV